MTLVFASFVAGLVTVAAPCVLPLLPVIVGGSLATGQTNLPKALRVTAGLAISVLLFGLLLKGTTALLGVPQQVWQWISGGIVLVFGLQMAWPRIWEELSHRLRLQQLAGALRPSTSTSASADYLLGAALGPIFNSCSPTYALIVAVILPVNVSVGIAYLAAYAAGLAVALLVVAVAGSRIINRLGWLTDPHGWFRRLFGVIFIAVGIAVIAGLDKSVQAWALENGWYNGFTRFERYFNS